MTVEEMMLPMPDGVELKTYLFHMAQDAIAQEVSTSCRKSPLQYADVKRSVPYTPRYMPFTFSGTASAMHHPVSAR